MGLLAHRCKTIWTVERRGTKDAPAIALAAVLAGAGLGPVLDPDVPELFGVKTARARLASACLPDG